MSQVASLKPAPLRKPIIAQSANQPTCLAALAKLLAQRAITPTLKVVVDNSKDK